MKKPKSKIARALALIKKGKTPAEAARIVKCDASNLYRRLVTSILSHALEPGEQHAFSSRHVPGRECDIEVRNGERNGAACILSIVERGRKLVVTLEWPL